MRVGFVLVCAVSLGLDVATASSQSSFDKATASVQSNAQPYSLDMIIVLALAKNPVVGLTEGNIEQQKGQQTAAGAYPNPTVTGNGGHGNLRDAGRANINEFAARDSLTESNLVIGQPIEWPSMRAARQRVADLGVTTANVGMLETRLNLASQVKVGFYDLLLAQQGADLARQNFDIVEGVARIVKARVKSGEAPQFESIKAEVEVLKARQQLVRADNLVRISRVAVDTLTGGALGPTYMVYGEFRILPRDLHIEGLMARMVEQHPTIQRLMKSVEQSDWKVEFERQSRVPTITVQGSYWREIGREAYQAGASMPVPLWYRRQGEIASALGAKRREEAELLRMRNELGRAVYQHYQDVRTTAELIDVFDKGLLKQGQEALRLAQFSFQQGASSLLEVFDAQRVQRQILLDYAQARHDLSVSLARLEQAVGGTL
ncbi:MAG: TolC family protein [Nitrospira sp.]|nr:TolC family protein [Nitrospira sp.]